MLVGASGAGKSTWAQATYRATEVVSSDHLRAVVGSGPTDLDASVDAFTLLDAIVAARLRRRLTTVIDTLGLDPDRRRAYLSAGRAAGIPCAAVVFTTPESVCRARNTARDRPVPAAAITRQLRAARRVEAEVRAEGWDRVLVIDGGTTGPDAAVAPVANDTAGAGTAEGGRSAYPQVVLNISRFPNANWASWLREVALAATEAGFAGIALMDHLIQIPQVGRAWEPILEPYVSLGLLAGLPTPLRLGALVSPVTWRTPGVLAKTVATLDVLSGGRAFCGIGAGWWEREHAAYGLAFPSAGDRVARVEAGIEQVRALWGPGTKPFAGRTTALPETTCYPRPVGDVPIITGGNGVRTLRGAARVADAVNVPATLAAVTRARAIVEAECGRVGRDPAEVALTVLDTPIVGADREDVARRVERLRGRTAAPVFAARRHAGLPEAHRERYAALAAAGVTAVFLALPEVVEPGELAPLWPMVRPGGAA